MRTLFWKIFAWFGAAQLLIVVALYLLASATQRGFDRGLVRTVGQSLEARSRAAAVAYELGGNAALQEAWHARPSHPDGPPPDDSPPPPRFDGDSSPGPAPKTLFDGGGRPDGPHGGPDERRFASLFVWRKSASTLLIGPGVPPDAAGVITDAFQAGEAVSDAGGRSLLARRVQTDSGALYVGVQRINTRGHAFGPLLQWLRLDAMMPIRFGMVAALMGALCFGLARYLSAPARTLAGATRQLADGDLSTRVGAKMGRRRDELADLGRDFDAMAARIEELVGAQRRLLSDISHELRSPLARLNVALELAGDSPPDEAARYHERIREESAELDAMIGQLLSLQRLEAHEAPIERTPLDLAALVKGIADNVAFEARGQGTEVEVRRLDACQMTGDAALLKSAVQNVARNAVLHSGQNCVHIALERNGNEALLWVRDFGPGVPDDALGKIFDPFYRVASARDRQSGGTGLGLSITKRAVQAHGGSVRALNVPDGGGLRVEIRLPLH